MRMWMVDPKILCRQHLFGEHLECHMFLGTLKKGNSIKGYLRNNLLEPKSLLTRHNQLVNEILKRGYNHHSPMEEQESEYLDHLSKEELNTKIDVSKAFSELLSRCERCQTKSKHLGGLIGGFK